MTRSSLSDMMDKLDKYFLRKLIPKDEKLQRLENEVEVSNVKNEKIQNELDTLKGAACLCSFKSVFKEGIIIRNISLQF